MSRLAQRDNTGRLHVEAAGVSQASQEIIWGLIADVRTYCHWGPWSATGDGDPRAERAGLTAAAEEAVSASMGPGSAGAIRWLRYGRRTTTVERIVAVEPGRRLAYTVVRGLPVRDYLAEVTLAPTGSAGTTVRWSANWDRTPGGLIVRRKLASLYPQVVSLLIAAADDLSRKVAA